MVSNPQTRVDKELLKIINFIRIEYLKRNKKPPTNAQITKIIAKRIKKEEILKDEFIRL